LEAVRKSVVDRLGKVCRERGLPYGWNDPNRLLDTLASQTDDPGLKALDKQRQKLLSCLHKAVGPSELRAAIAEIGKALAAMEELAVDEQPGNGDRTGNGEPAKPGTAESDFFGRLKQMRSARQQA
jgi:hypothetical protein